MFLGEYLIAGIPNIWLGIPASHKNKLEPRLAGYFPLFTKANTPDSSVRTTPSIPRTEKCGNCSRDVTERHRTGGPTSTFVRVLLVLLKVHCCNLTKLWRRSGS